jgi:hypothetical protein
VLPTDAGAATRKTTNSTRISAGAGRRRSRDEDEDADEDRPRRRRYQDEEEEEDEDYDRKALRREARRRGNAAAIWFVIAAIISLVMAALNITGNLMSMGQAGQPQGDAAFQAGFKAGQIGGILGCGAVVLAGAICQFQAGSALRSLRGKGKVVSGIVFGFIFGVVFLIGLAINSLGLAFLPAGAHKTLVMFAIVVGLAACGLNFFAAIKGLVTLNNIDVGRAFRRNS